MTKKSTALALSNPTVSQNINLNLTQNDIIDIAIQERLSQLEVLIETKLEQIKANTAKHKEVLDSILKKISDKILDKDPDYKKFIKLSEISGYKTIVSYQAQDRYQNDQLVIAIIDHIDFNNIGNYKNPLQMIYQRKTRQNFSVATPNNIYIKAKVEFPKESKTTLCYDSNLVSVPQAMKPQFVKLLKPIVEQEVKLHQELYDLKLDQLKFEYGEKKVKAQIIKLSLTKSEEGRGILSLLEEATKLKLLG